MSGTADVLVLRPSAQPMEGDKPMAPLALRREAAAAALGVSEETFDRYVRPHLAVVRLGTVRVYPVTAIAAFLEHHGTVPAEDVAA